MDPQVLCCIALTTRCKPWRSLCVQFFAPPSTPFFWLALGFGLLALRTHGGWTTEFRAHRATFTVLAPARRAASVAKLHVYLGHVSLANRAGSPLLSVPIATCSGISALPTRVDRPSEFHGHRALFTDLAPARRGEISVFHVACSAGPCGPAPPAATAPDFNTEFSRATFRDNRDLADS